MCCGNDDGDAASARRGRRQTHVVIAAQYNRAFDDSAPAVDKSLAVIEDQSPSSAKENGVVAATETSTAEPTAPASDAEHADRELDSTIANGEADGEVLNGVTVTPSEIHFPDAAADSADAENVNRARENVAGDEIENVVEPTTNDSDERVNDVISDRTSADTSASSDDCVTSLTGSRDPATSPLVDDEKADLATAALSDSCVSPSSRNTAETQTTEPEMVFMQVPLPETENNCRTKTAPIHRRCRSMGAGSRQRRVIDTPSCDKAVDVHEDDLVVQPEPEIVTDNETDALSEATTDEENRELGEQMAKEGNGEEDNTEDRLHHAVRANETNLESPRTVENLVLDLDELGLLTTLDVKPEEEVSDLCILFNNF